MSADRPQLAVRPMSSDLLGEAARLLARAFADDPVLSYYFRPGWRRMPAFRAFFRAALWEGLPAGQTYAATSGGRLVGVALWLPPAAGRPSRWARARSMVALLPLRLMFPHAARALFAGFHALESHHPHEPHWYLAFVGIEPSQQGRGIGRRLLAPVLDEADRNADGCYLETPFPATHSFYRSLGFTELAELHPFAGAPPVTSFVRRPVDSPTTRTAESGR